MRNRHFVAALLAFILCFCANWSFAGGQFSISWGDNTSGVRSTTGVQTDSSAPPAHAPAHGHRAKQRYDYYPDACVYFSPESGSYFYLEGSNWRVSASLPNDLKVRLGSSVSLELDTDRPYIYNQEHKAKYPPGKMKSKRKRARTHGKKNN